MRWFFFALVGVMALLSLHGARADGLPKIAVTNLTYEERVRSFFSYYASQERSAAERTDRYSGAAASERNTVAASGEITTIERGEMHKFTSDIRGALIKSGAYRITESRPWTDSETVKIYDVIERIKSGHYPDADYVLFGTLTDINSRNQALPIQGTAATNYQLSMELVADFSLIDTRTYEVVAGFSAMGEGTDSRLINTAGAVISFNRGKVIRDVSQSLSEAVLAEIQAQFKPGASFNSPGMKTNELGNGDKVIIYR